LKSVGLRAAHLRAARFRLKTFCQFGNLFIIEIFADEILSNRFVKDGNGYISNVKEMYVLNNPW